MTSLRRALSRLTQPNSLTLIGLSDADREVMAIAEAAVRTERERDERRARAQVFAFDALDDPRLMTGEALEAYLDEVVEP